MKNLLGLCLLLCTIGCASKPSSQLSDEKFIAVLADVIDLHRQYPFDPDSLKVQRATVFKRHNITTKDIEQFLDNRRDQPDQWDPLLDLLQKRFGDAAESHLKSFQKTPAPKPTKKTEQQ